MATGVQVHGLAELQRAYKRIDKDLARETRDALKKVAEPVKNTATGLAQSMVSRNIGRWGEMRIGVTTRAVYVAPKARNRGGSPRSNFGAMLLNDALIPALEKHEATIIRGLEEMIDELADRNGF